jgi:predicted dehydrogenase
LGVPGAYGDYRALLAEAPIDAVAVITPPDQHAPITLAALAAGKHVLCAKPLASSLAEAETIRARAQASGLVHAIDQQQRFLPSMRFAKELIDDGAIGRPLSLVNTFGLHLPSYYANPGSSPNKGRWFSDRSRSGGVFLANAPHEFDRLLWLFGAVRSLAGRAHTAVPVVVLDDGSRHTVDAEDSYHAVLMFASGLVGVVQCAPIATKQRLQRLEVYGDGGSLLLEAAGGAGGDRVVLHAARGATDYAPLPVPERLALEAPVGGGNGAVYALCDRFIGAILDGQPMSPTFDDAVRVQALIEAVRESDRSGTWQVVSPSAP